MGVENSPQENNVRGMPYRIAPTPPRPRRREPQSSYDNLEASLLLCPKCRQAQPVRKRLLLVLPEGDKYEYVCTQCGSTCGDKIEVPARAAY